MKHSILIYTLITLVTVSSCNKVEKDLNAQYDQPSVSLTGITLPDGTALNYPTDARPGDTLTIAGRLNLSKGATIRLGQEDAEIIDRDSFMVNYPATGVNYYMEKARFVVTNGMGTGPQPLTVTYKSYHVQAPDINIIVPGTGGSEPDTTLVITRIFDGNGTDAYLARYKTYSSAYIDVALALTNDGTVYFASKQDIYRIRNNAMEWLLKKEDGITIEGTQYPITQLIGMAPTPDNTAMYFSFYSTVSAPDNFNRIYWLLRKNLNSGVVTVINKTEVGYLSNGLYSGITRPGANPYGRVPVDQMPVFAYQLKVDAKGRLLFFNYNIHNNQREVEYYCRMDPSGNNLVTPLFEKTNSQAGVFKCLFNIAYTQDGLATYIAHEENTVWPRSTGVTVMDLETLEPTDYVDSKVNITYASFDPNPERRMKLRSSYIYFDINSILPGDQFPISRKEMLFVNSYSIASVNPELAYLYCYAGLEIGCAPSGGSDGKLLPEQNKLIGQAKYVNFNGTADYGGRVRFIGMDAKGDIYYLRGGQYILSVSGGVKRYYLPPIIYKISKP